MKQGFHAEEASQRPFPTQRSVKSRKVLDGWRTIESRKKKRNALLISFRLCRLKFSLETFCLRLWEEGREFETATGSIPRKIFGQRLVKEWAKGWNVTDCGRGD